MLSRAWGSSSPVRTAGCPRSRSASWRPSISSALTEPIMGGCGGGERRGRASAGGGALLFLDETLASDAVAGEGQRFESLVADGLAAALAVAEGTVVDLLKRGHDVAQQAPVAVAQLEEELPVVGGVRLVAEVLDRIVFLILAVGRGASDAVGELPLLLEQLFLEARQSLFLHHDLPGDVS